VKAAFYTGSKHFSVEDIDPRPPAADEVQIDVGYCGICGTDMHVYQGHMDKRVGFHRIIGHEMSGVITAVGEGAGPLVPGDRVVVRPLAPCGHCPACRAGYAHICHKLNFIGLDSDGALQQKWNVPKHTIHKIPASMSLRQAVLVEPTAVACHVVRRSRLTAGEDVLVIGGGPIGMLVAMVAAHAGGNVALTEINPLRLQIARDLGVKTVMAENGDVAAAVHAATGSKGADVVFEVSGSRAGARLMTAAASTRGRIAMVAIHAERPEVDLFQFFWRELEMIGCRVYEPQDYDQAIDLIARGAITPHRLITDVVGLDQVNQAFAALDGNAKAMKSLIVVNESLAN